MLTHEMKPETERRLRRAAERAGKPLETLVEEAVAPFLADAEGPKRTGTGGELLQELKSLNLSPEYGDGEITARLNAVHSETESGLDPAFRARQADSLPKDDW